MPFDTVHLRLSAQDGRWTACVKRTAAFKCTDDRHEVTCRPCLAALARIIDTQAGLAQNPR